MSTKSKNTRSLDHRVRTKPTPTGLWLSKLAVCARYDSAPSTIDRWVADGSFPAPTKFGRLSRWHVSTLDAFDSRLLDSTEG